MTRIQIKKTLVQGRKGRDRRLACTYKASRDGTTWGPTTTATVAERTMGTARTKMIAATTGVGRGTRTMLNQGFSVQNFKTSFDMQRWQRIGGGSRWDLEIQAIFWILGTYIWIQKYKIILRSGVLDPDPDSDHISW